jgi:hypothetical protein
LQTNPVEKFYKKIDKKPKPMFSRFRLSRFWAFLDKGSVKKHHFKKKYREKNLTLVLFWPLTHPPTHHGGHRLFVLAAPCSRPGDSLSGCGGQAVQSKSTGWEANEPHGLAFALLGLSCFLLA